MTVKRNARKAMFTTCILLSLTLCQAIKDVPVVSLAGTSTIVMLEDGQTTMNLMRENRIEGLTNPHIEIDPVSRIFIGKYPTWQRMAPAGTALVISQMYLAERMKRSHTWLRHLWWLPQGLTITANSWGVQHNLLLK